MFWLQVIVDKVVEIPIIIQNGEWIPAIVKQALHIHVTSVEECFNWDEGLEDPGCWMVVIRRQELFFGLKWPVFLVVHD